MKLGFVCAAVVGLAGSAFGQAAFVTNIPGSFIDISTTGTSLGGGDDNSYNTTVAAAVSNALFPAGTIGVCTNGHAGYGGNDTQYFNNPLPASFAYTGAAAAVFWDDLITQRAGAGLYAQTIGNTLIIQWNNMDHFFTSPNGITFELQIFGTGTGPGGAYAQYIYQNVDTGDQFANAADATLGFQYGPGSATQFSYNTASIQSGSVLSLVPVPAPSSLALLGFGGLLAGRRRR